MVSLTELYKVKESVLNEIKDHGDPARGNKGKNREREYYFVDEPADPETGGIKSEELKEIFNTLRTHVRKNYKDE